MLILCYQDVKTTLAGRELEMIDLVTDVYGRHARGLTSVPYSTFLHFPDDGLNRIIGLPAVVEEARRRGLGTKIRDFLADGGDCD
jgi:hypothetical protein